MVFRLDPGKFKDLKHEFGEFLKRVTYLFDDLIKNTEVMDLQVMIGEICNWQVWYIICVYVCIYVCMYACMSNLFSLLFLRKQQPVLLIAYQMNMHHIMI